MRSTSLGTGSIFSRPTPDVLLQGMRDCYDGEEEEKGKEDGEQEEGGGGHSENGRGSINGRRLAVSDAIFELMQALGSSTLGNGREDDEDWEGEVKDGMCTLAAGPESRLLRADLRAGEGRQPPKVTAQRELGTVTFFSVCPP